MNFSCVHGAVCTAACGCVLTCPPGADGVACDDGDPATIGDLCLAGTCAGFSVTTLSGPGFGAMTVVDLHNDGDTMWAVGSSIGASPATSWIAPVLPGAGLSHTASSDVQATLDEASAGLAVGGLTTRVLQGGLWRYDPELKAALDAGAPFGDLAAVWGTPLSGGGAEYWLVGRKHTFDAARVARCVHAPEGPWTCTDFPFSYSNPSTLAGVVANLFPQTVTGLTSDGAVTYVASHGVVKDSKGDFKYNIAALDLLADPGATTFPYLGGFFSAAGSGFVYDASGIAAAEGAIWAGGKGGFLATVDASDPAIWSWKTLAVEGQASANFRALATVEGGTLALDERLAVTPSGAAVYRQLLHLHPAGTHFNRWLPATLERRSSACVAAGCPTSVPDAFGLDAMGTATGRLVLTGAGWDVATGTAHTRVLERRVDPSCPATLVSASFDDGTPGALIVESNDEQVGWHPAPSWAPPGASGPLRGTLYFGDPSKASYAAAGKKSAGSLSTGVLLVPEVGETRARLQIWFDTEDDPDYDTIEVRLVCKGPVCPAGPEVLLFDNKTGAPPAKTWHAVEASLAGYEGSVVELRVTFDTVDGVKNDFTGFFVDALQVVTTCPPDECTACDDGDPCTTDTCWLGRCLHPMACDLEPMAATFDEAAIIKGVPYAPSIGWSTGDWVLGAPGGGLEGVWATLEAESYGEAPVDTPLDAPPVLLADPATAEVAFEVAFKVGPIPGSSASTLRLVAAPLEGGEAVTVWETDATGSGAPAAVAVPLDALSPGAWSLRFVAHLEPPMAVTWRVRR